MLYYFLEQYYGAHQTVPYTCYTITLHYAKLKGCTELYYTTLHSTVVSSLFTILFFIEVCYTTLVTLLYDTILLLYHFHRNVRALQSYITISKCLRFGLPLLFGLRCERLRCQIASDVGRAMRTTKAWWHASQPLQESGGFGGVRLLGQTCGPREQQ